MSTYETPGVYRDEALLAPPAPLRTGVPAFLGYAVPRDASVREVDAVDSAAEYGARYGPPADAAHVAAHLRGAVDGFFANGGARCFVVLLDPALQPQEAVAAGLLALDVVDEVDLVSAPDAVRRLIGHAALPLPAADATEMQQAQRLVLDYCGSHGRFALLDSLPRAGVDDVIEQRRSLIGADGALYYPWIRTQAGGDAATAFGPPSGHVAGVYARSDERVGVHKAPANELLHGVLDLATSVSNDQQARLNPIGVNCLRAFPGRGIRVWGARTLSPEPAWAQVNVRRIFLTAARWIDRAFAHLVFEPNGPEIWDYVERELGDYFGELYRRGALRGSSAQEAFRITCDAETNTPERRDAGEIVTDIALAPTVPNEFVVVQIVHRAEGITIAGPNRAG